MALIGGFGTGNFGNDASLAATLQLLRKAASDASYTCICHDPKIVQARFNIPTVKMAHQPTGVLRLLDTVLLRLPSGLTNWLRSLWLAGRFDVMIWAGTGLFDDYRTGPLGFPAQVFRWSLAARLRGVAVVCSSVGAGPIVNPLSRFFLKAAALCAQHRSYRDDGSRDFMQSIGVDESKSAIFPDIVIAAESKVSRQPLSREVTIGLGVMAYRGWRRDAAIEARYMQNLARFVGYAKSKGYKLVYLVAEPSDMRALVDLRRMINDAASEHDRPMATLDDVMNAAASCHVVVGSRFHVLIAGLKVRRPCISLSYGPKHDLLMASAGIPDFCQPADDFDVDKLAAHLEEIIARLPHYEKIVDSNLSVLEHQSGEFEVFIMKALDEAAHGRRQDAMRAEA